MTEIIAQITDLHLDEAFPFDNHVSARRRFDNVLKDINSKNITNIICTGDIGENNGINYFFEKLKEKKLTITLGNHDSFDTINQHYDIGANHASKKIYSSKQGTYFKTIYMDSSEGIIDKKQLLWLEKELKSVFPIIIFIHHPIIGLNLKVDEIGKLKNRQEVLSLLTKSKCDITIFCGHYHMESSLLMKNVKQFITPAISFQIKKKSNSIEIDTNSSGYRIIYIENGQLSSKIQWLNNAD